MKAAIIGYGIEGKVSAAYWAAMGADITICDQKAELTLPDGYLSQLGPDHLNGLEKFDVIVRTAGIRPQLILDANQEHPEIIDRITTSMNEFVRVCPSKNVIGITGTKGKGTTSTLVTKMLQAAGKTAHLGGNIGIAPLEMLPAIKPDDWVVLEMSSFQLIDFTGHIPIAACLMMAPEHLNWHPDLEEYFTAKSQLFAHQLLSDTTVYNIRSKESKDIASKSKGTLLGYDVPADGQTLTSKDAAYVLDGTIYYQQTPVMPVSDIKLLGRHNQENICAAISLVWSIIEGNVEAIKEVATTFTGLAHHTEYVTTINGVKYIDDSYSTMPNAAIAAIAAVPEPKVMITGGVDKGISLDDMITAIASADIRHVVLIGSMAEAIKGMLAAKGFDKVSLSTNDMPSIVAEAQKYAQPGDVVLLSPGCAAKGDGYFIDGTDRGNQFKQVLLAQ